MTHPEFNLPVQDCETDHGIDNYDDLPEEFGGDTLEPTKVTELTSQQITLIRVALRYRAEHFDDISVHFNECYDELLNLFEFGCGVTVRNCEAQSQYDLDNYKDEKCSWPGCTCEVDAGEEYCKQCLKVTRS